MLKVGSRNTLKLRSCAALVSVAAVALALATAAQADVTLYAQNFDALTAGATIAGQGSPAFETYYYGASQATGSAAATVQTNGVGGSKGLQFDSSQLTVADFAYQPNTNIAFTGKKIAIQFSIDINPKLNAASASTRSQYNVDVYSADFKMLTSLILTPTGNLTSKADGATTTNYTLPAAITADEGFNTFKLLLDYTGATPSGTLQLNGTTLAFALAVSPQTSTMSDIDLSSLGNGADSAVYDNVSIVQVIPEPATLGAIAAGMIGLRRRR